LSSAREKKPALRDWLSAFRLRTLPLASSAMLVGGGLGFTKHSHAAGVFVLSLFTAFLLQILSNLANDYGDTLHGADNAGRVGPQRAVQSGRISPVQMKRAIAITAGLALVTGVSLLILALGSTGNWTAFWILFATGLLAIGAAYQYTAGSKPYGYQGLGDVSVFLFFGLVGVVGSAFLYTGVLMQEAVLPACWVGLQSAAVLNLNNLRDHENDRASGKMTIVARLGYRGGVIYHALLVMTASMLMTVWAMMHSAVWMWAIAIGWTVLSVLQLGRLMQVKQFATIDPELKKTALATFACALVFFAGYILANG
jgi:1,4-dihydroxy-2-naphthoate polyprenyltransferase